MKAKRICLWGLLLFTVLSFLDLAQTRVLIHHGGGRIYESNPVASIWLKEYGWEGLAFFKGAIILTVAGAVVLLTRYQPRLGALVVIFGCLVLIWVTVYSWQLLNELPSQPEYMMSFHTSGTSSC